jgi:hypothetical protein
MILLENYLDKLYTSYEQEIRGENKPIENVDRRPNYIGMCFNMMETDQLKIKCLRKIRELTVMNPFYQYRIDRFIDAITDSYEPSDKPGFTEFIRGEKDSSLVENINNYLNHLNDQAPPPGKGPGPKFIKLKASGAEQDDEEPPTTARTKRFEKDEAKVGIKEEPLTVGTLLATTALQKVGVGAAAAGGAYLLGKKVKKDLKQRCYVTHQGYPERIKRCLQTGK